jgi:hypothetical protein
VAQLKNGPKLWLKSLDSATSVIQPRFSEFVQSVKSWATLEEFLRVHVLHVARTYWKLRLHLVQIPTR